MNLHGLPIFSEKPDLAAQNGIGSGVASKAAGTLCANLF